MICRRCLHMFVKGEKIASKKTASASVHADRKVCIANLKPYKVATMKTFLLFALALFGTLCRAQSVPDAPIPKHDFFDKKNVWLFSVSTASIIADGVSTRRNAMAGEREMNPLARPFVKSNGRALLYFGASDAALIGGTYLLHRTNHHKMERWLPLLVSGTETFWAIHNTTCVHGLKHEISPIDISGHVPHIQ